MGDRIEAVQGLLASMAVGSTKQILEHLRAIQASKAKEINQEKLLLLIKVILSIPAVADEIIMVTAMIAYHQGIPVASPDPVRQAWIDLGVMRASSALDEATARRLLEGGLSGGYGSGSLLLAARCLETLQDWFKDCTDLESWFPLLLASLYTDDELLQQKGREAMVRLAQMPDCHARLMPMICALDPGLKVKYQLIRDLRRPWEEERPRLLAECTQALLSSASLAPAAADALCCLNPQESELEQLFAAGDEGGSLRYFLIPRLVKSSATGLQNWLAQSKSDSPIWVRAAACLVEAKQSVACPSPAQLSIWLRSADASVRQDAWTIVCAHEYEELMIPFCIDLQVNGGAEDRQRCLATLRHWLKRQLALHYKFLRTERQDPDWNAELIVGIFRACSSVAPTLPFGRLQWSLSVLRGINEALATNPYGDGKVAQDYAASLQELRQRLWADGDLLHRLTCVMLDSSFGQVQREAQALLLKADYQLPEQVAEMALRRLSSPREPVQLGSALALQLKGGYSIEWILAQVKVELGQAELTHRINGLLVFLQLSVENCKYEASLIVQLCEQIARRLFPLAAHPSPEGLGEEDCEAGEGHSQLTLAWRTIREAGNIIAVVADVELMEGAIRFLVEGLLTLRHPGAFNALADPLAILFRKCYQVAALAAFPKQILEVVHAS